MKLLTNSIRRKFGACPRAYQHAYVLLRRPAVEHEALAFGTLTHKALEAWWSHTPEHRRLAALHILSVEAEKEGADPYQLATCRALIEGYDSQWEHQDLDPVVVETEFQAPLMNPETGGVSKTWILSGKIDAIAREKDTGRLVIVEHKTTTADLDPTSDYWPKLAIDGQVSGYYLGARTLGYEVEDCVYDVIRKPGIRPSQIPLVDEDGVKIVLDGNYNRVKTKDGKKWRESGSTAEGYTLQTRMETAEEYEARLLADIAERPDRYYARKRVARLESDMQEYLYDMWAVGRNIADAERLGRFSRNPDSCSGFGTCEYFGVCSGVESLNDDRLFKTLESATPELSTQSIEQLALEAAFKE
jgi:hypothetical protein